jgi:hypothetical protein
MQNTITLAEAIRLAIHRSGHTAGWIAAQMNVSARTVSNWQTGATMPKFDDLVHLARITGADVEDFADTIGHTRRYPFRQAAPDTIEMPFPGVIHVDFPQHMTIDLRDPDPGGHAALPFANAA